MAIVGTWGAGVEDDDVFVDVYQDFMQLYNEGLEPLDVSSNIRTEFAWHFENPDDYGPALFALALASWETKVLTDDLFLEVKEYIDSGRDLENLRERDATENHLASRSISAKEFLAKIASPRPRKKRRTKPKVEVVRMVELMSPDDRKELLATKSYFAGKYAGTVVILVWCERGGGGGQILEIQDEHLEVKAWWNSDSEVLIQFSHVIQMEELPISIPFYGSDIHLIYEVVE